VRLQELQRRLHPGPGQGRGEVAPGAVHQVVCLVDDKDGVLQVEPALVAEERDAGIEHVVVVAHQRRHLRQHFQGDLERAHLSGVGHGVGSVGIHMGRP